MSIRSELSLVGIWSLIVFFLIVEFGSIPGLVLCALVKVYQPSFGQALLADGILAVIFAAFLVLLMVHGRSKRFQAET